MSSGSDVEREGLEVADSVHHPVKGIKNHGNTCFFNAMLQAVNQTKEFHNMYVMKPYEKKYPILDKDYSVSVAQPSEVARTLCQTFDQFTNSDIVSAKRLLNSLGKRHSRFVRGTQEDSHEVLRALLDDVKSEEIENVKKEIMVQFDATKCNASSKDGEQNLELKSHLRMASKVDVAISKAVQGSVVSVVICHECHSVVENVEPFFDLSLPIVTKTSIEGKTSDYGNNEGYDNDEVYGNNKVRARDRLKNLGNTSGCPILGKRTKLNITDEPSPKRQKPSDSVPTTTHDDNPPQAVAHDSNVFQEYLKKSGYKHLYRHAAQLNTVQNFHTDLEHCLLTFTDLDVLDEDNKFICKSCTERKHQTGDGPDDEVPYVLCRVSKQLMIHQLPPVLILHIKRFEIGHYRVTKDSRFVSFPKILDLAPYCTVDCVKVCISKLKLHEDIIPSIHIEHVTERSDSNSQILYGLYAVVVHHGSSLYSGHYISYVKTRPSKAGDTDDGEYCRTEYNRDYCSKGQWYLANDTYVQECQFEKVENNQAYMLFYELLPLRQYRQLPGGNEAT